MNLLPYAYFQPLPLRSVRSSGWLHDLLQRQAAGLAGNVAVSGYPYGYKFWGSQEDDIKGSYGTWWPYEQTGYWIDGALKCAYLVADADLYRQALEEIDFALAHADADGFIGPEHMRAKDRWPHAVFFRAVLAQYEITGERRYLEALERHYQVMLHPLVEDRDVTGVEILLYLYRESGQAEFLEMAADLYTRFNQQFPEHDCALQNLLSERRQTEHGVTYNEEAKLAALLYAATGEQTYLKAVVNGYDKLDRDSLLADGLHSCSEHLQGKGSREMHETCDITDHTWALSYLLQATGEACYADRIERVIFNALPGAITKDFRALQYLSCPNQVVVTNASNHNFFMRGLNWMSYRPDHEVQCCPGNLHRALPNYVSQMWMQDPQGGLVAALYGPGSLQTRAGAGQTPITINAETRYPFEQAVTFTFQPEKAAAFAFSVRIPAWCRVASLILNGQALDANLVAGSFFRLERTWQAGDVLRLELPFELALDHWPRGGISLTYGPLTLALPVPTQAEIETHNSTVQQRRDTLGETYQPRPTVEKPDFPAWNLTPTGPWNYALCVDENSLKDLQVEWNETFTDPLDAANPPLKLSIPARRVRHWRLIHTRKARQFGHWTEGEKFCRGPRTIEGDFRFTPVLPDPQKLPGRLSDSIEQIELIPYGATLLRVTVFPQA